MRDSTPERRRSRYGDMDYDWEHRVNTGSGTVDWRDRLLGTLLSPYMPTDPSEFKEMMAALPIDFRKFTFIDLGSGKGRTLLMASEYPFAKIVGVEILPGLDRAARENIRAYQSPSQQCSAIESVCSDARNFELPAVPLLLYLFNPLPEAALRELIAHIEASLSQSPRDIWILYNHPVLEPMFASSTAFTRMSSTPHYSLFRTAGLTRPPA